MGPAFLQMAPPPPQVSGRCQCCIGPLVMLALQNPMWETQEGADGGNLWPGLNMGCVKEPTQDLKNHLSRGSFASLE